MSATTIVAIYAAVVSTGLLLIALEQLRANRTRVVLKINPGTAKVQTSDIDPDTGDYAEVDGEVVYFRIVNKSGHPIKIDGIGAIRPKRGGEQPGFVSIRPYPLHLVLPFEIPARDNRTLWILREGLDESEPLRFWVRTTAGDSYETKPLRLDEQQHFEMLVPES